MCSRFWLRPATELIARPRPSGGAGTRPRPTCQPICQKPATGASKTAGSSMPVTSVEGTSSQA